MTGDLPFHGEKEARALIAAHKEEIELGAEEIKHTIKTTDDWEFSVTIKVIRWGAL